MSKFSHLVTAIRVDNTKYTVLLDTLQTATSVIESAGRWIETLVIESFLFERMGVSR